MGNYQKLKIPKSCKGCGNEFSGPPKQTFCNVFCRNKHYSLRRKNANPAKFHLPTGTVGAMHELLVSVALLRAGFSVYRAVTPDAPCDLAILKEQKLILIEVTTGSRTLKGDLVYPLHKKHSHIHDVIAVVERDGGITYIPELIIN